MNIAQILLRSATVYPNRPAVFLGERCLFDYRTLAARAASIGGYLRDTLGLAPGERVAAFMTNCPEYLEVLYGIWWAGLSRCRSMPSCMRARWPTSSVMPKPLACLSVATTPPT